MSKKAIDVKETEIKFVENLVNNTLEELRSKGMESVAKVAFEHLETVDEGATFTLIFARFAVSAGMKIQEELDKKKAMMPFIVNANPKQN